MRQSQTGGNDITFMGLYFSVCVLSLVLSISLYIYMYEREMVYVYIYGVHQIFTIL